MSRLSVIVPVYNVEKYLRICLDSLINQTLKDIEIICVDDASTDNSYAILKEYATKDSRVKIFRNQQNSGVSHTRNKALELAQSPYISFIDPDDYIELFTFEEALKYFDEKIGFVVWNSDLINENITSTSRGDIIGNYGDLGLNGIQPLTIDTIVQTKTTSCNKIFKKSILDEFKIKFPEHIKVYEDSSFVLKYFSHVDFAYYLNKRLYHYRKREGSLTLSLHKLEIDQFTCRIKALEDIFDHYNEYNLVEKYRPMLAKLFSICFIEDFNNCPLERKVALIDETMALCNKIGIQVFK